MLRTYGWKRDRVDHRDYMRVAMPPHTTPLPSKVDLRLAMPPVFDQGQLGSCTGNAIAAAFEYEMNRQHLHVFRPSRLFIYYNERLIEGTIDEDAGAEIRDGLKAVGQYGVCPEYQWPYSDDGIRFKQKPPAQCYDAAMKHQALVYHRVSQDPASLRQCLASGTPFVFGFTVYQSFEDDGIALTGQFSMPADGEKNLGGHAVCAVGYDDNHLNLGGTRGAILVRNSWSESWGVKGYFWMPYKFILSGEASDFWCINTVD